MAVLEGVDRDVVAKAIYYAPNGIDGDAVGTMIYENERVECTRYTAKEATLAVCQQAARAAIDALIAQVRDEEAAAASILTGS